MIHFFHRLFHYHCSECDARPVCMNCETLRSLLDIEKREKKQLLDSILEYAKPPVVIKEEPSVEKREFKSRPLTWRVRQEILEQEDRKKAEILGNLKREEVTIKNEELEKELGIS